MNKILVTGGMGFIGNHLAHRLLELGHEVIILDKSVYKPIYLPVPKAEIIEGDVLSRELLHTLLQRVDCCIHLAALASVNLCERDWIFSHENNVLAFNGLLEEIARLNKPIKLVYASSAAVYGLGKHLPFTESEHVLPCSTYGADKLSNELYAMVMEHTHHLPSIGLRFFNVYGPGQLADNPYSGVITTFKQALLDHKPIKIFGDGLQTRDFIYIEDIIQALLLAMNSPPELSDICNVCTGQAISILDLAKTMMKLSGVKVDIEFHPERVGDIKHAYGDPALAKSLLKFTATTSIEQGLGHYMQIQ